MSIEMIEGSIHNIFSNNWNSNQIASFLVALNIKGVSGEILSIFARYLRKNSHFFEESQNGGLTSLNNSRPFGDSCGTGGDGVHTFNISTLASLVAAAGGVKIAKHGNRSVSSLCGSADLLFQLGYPESLSLKSVIHIFNKTGITFLFAPNLHPLMKSIAPIRKSLGIPTVLNYVGPLSNPLNPDFQLIGVNQKRLLTPIAEALVLLDVKSALVIHSRDGLDEVSPGAITDGIRVDHGKCTNFTIDPHQLGVKGCIDDLKGGDAPHNSNLLWKIVDARPEVAILSQTVCLNAAVLFWLSGLTSDIKEGFLLATSLIQSFKVRTFLKSWLEEVQKIHLEDQNL